MVFKRELLAKNVVELTGTTPTSLGVTFKQYDVFASTLLIDTTFNELPTHFTNETVYIIYSHKDGNFGEVVPVVDAENNRIRDFGTFSTKVDGRVIIEVSKEVLNCQGEILAEMMIIGANNTYRFTSPTLKFKIAPSLVSNTTSNGEMAICGTFEVGTRLVGQGLDSKIIHELITEVKGEVAKNVEQDLVKDAMIEAIKEQKEKDEVEKKLIKETLSKMVTTIEKDVKKEVAKEVVEELLKENKHPLYEYEEYEVNVVGSALSNKFKEKLKKK